MDCCDTLPSIVCARNAVTLANTGTKLDVGIWLLTFFKIFTDTFSFDVEENGILKPPTLKCDSVYGVKSGDTCFGVAQMFNLSTEFFDAINPNLNCTALFVGQWLCLDGKLS